MASNTESNKDMENEENETTSDNDNKKKEKKAFDYNSAFSYLQKLKDALSIFKDTPALVAITKLYLYSINATSSKKLEITHSCLNYDFPRILCDIMGQSYKALEEYLNTNSTNAKNIDDDKNKDEEQLKKEKEQNVETDKTYELCIICIGIVRNFSNYSVKFVSQAHKYDVIKELFKFLNNDKLVEAYEKRGEVKSKEMLRSAIGSLVNLSKLYSSFSEKWKAENAVETLLAISERLKHRDDFELASYIALASIVDEDQIVKLEGVKKVIPGIVKMIGKIAKTIETKKDLIRIKVNLDETSNETYKIARTSTHRTVWHLIELIDALYHMSCSDTIKFEIYETNKMSVHLRSIINHGNATEIEYCLKLLWQLCFDDRIAQDVRNDETLMAKINKLMDCKLEESIDGTKVSTGLIKNSKGIIWLINKKCEAPKELEELAPNTLDDIQLSDKPEESKHIMISYNRDSRELCAKIKEELEKNKFKVWIDFEEIHGSSLESMARAVEDSMCVLICMTEKYKMSPFCRAEAEYTFQLGKPLIPLIMQDNYKPDGWLGIILGSKIFINFTKYDFAECTRRLLSEIRNTVGLNGEEKRKESATKVETKATGSSSNHNHNNNAVNNWSESDVEKWLREKQINPVISQNVFPCNGQILNQLYSIQSEAPEFFYKSISSNQSIPTKDVAIFTFELKRLFQ